jgi:MFS family permease
VIRRPGIVLALLTGLNLLNYLDRFVLSAVLPKVQEDLHLSNFVAGSLSTVFLIGYFATSPIFGHLADRAPSGGRTRLIALGIAVWSAATVASGLARGVATLVAARAFVGVGEASYATIAPTLIDDVAPQGKSGRWLSIFFTAIPVGSALGYILGGEVQHATGSWQASFLVAGGPGLLLALASLLVAEPPRRAREALPDLIGASRELFSYPTFAKGVYGYCAYTFAMGGFAYWAPKYIYARYGGAPGRSASVFGTITVVAGFVGTLVGGWIADARTKAALSAPAGQAAREGGREDSTTVRVNLEVCVVSAAAGAPLAAAAVLAPTAAQFYAWTFPCEVMLFLSTGPVNVVLLRSAPPELRASAMALSIFAIHLLGDLWSPPLIGLASDHAPIEWAMMAVPAGFALAAIVWWMARSGQVDRTGSGALRANAS